MISAVTKRITTKTTTHAVTSSCVLHQIVIACSNAGTAWTLAIQDLLTAVTHPDPFIWIPGITLALPADGLPLKVNFDFPIPMNGGIDIVTAGTTPGVVCVCLVIEQ